MTRTLFAVPATRTARRGDAAGFSLVEVVAVVLVLGLLAAIAVPVFSGLQAEAEQNAVDTIAAAGATQVVSDFAQERDVEEVRQGIQAFAATSGADVSFTGGDIDTYCVTAVLHGRTATSGPDCLTIAP